MSRIFATTVHIPYVRLLLPTNMSVSVCVFKFVASFVACLSTLCRLFGKCTTTYSARHGTAQTDIGFALDEIVNRIHLHTLPIGVQLMFSHWQRHKRHPHTCLGTAPQMSIPTTSIAIDISHTQPQR